MDYQSICQGNYIAPLQRNYSKALPAKGQARIKS